jgi:hypothetical protein
MTIGELGGAISALGCLVLLALYVIEDIAAQGRIHAPEEDDGADLSPSQEERHSFAGRTHRDSIARGHTGSAGGSLPAAQAEPDPSREGHLLQAVGSQGPHGDRVVEQPFAVARFDRIGARLVSGRAPLAPAAPRRLHGEAAGQPDTPDRALRVVALHHQRRLSGRTTRRQRLQRLLYGPARHDDAVGGPLPDRQRLGAHTDRDRLRLRGAGVRGKRLLDVVARTAVACYLAALSAVRWLTIDRAGAHAPAPKGWRW